MNNYRFLCASAFALLLAISTTGCVEANKDQAPEDDITQQEQENSGEKENNLTSKEENPGLAEKEKQEPDSQPADQNTSEPINEENEEQVYLEAKEAKLGPSSEPADQNTSEPVVIDSEEQLRLANELLKNLAFQEFYANTTDVDIDNFVISPLTSLNTTAMLLHAASGESASNISSALDWESKEFPLLSSWSSEFSGFIEWDTTTWGQTGYLFADGYVDSLANIFNSQFDTIDFLHLGINAKEHILPWIAEDLSAEDSSLIKGLDNISQQTRLVFANQFNIEMDLLSSSPAFEVTQGLWQDTNDYQENIIMLKAQGDFLVVATDDCKAAQIPLADSSIELTVVMPNSETFSATEAILENVLLEFQDDATLQYIEFRLPVFNVQSASKIGSIVPDGAYPKDVTACPENDCSENIAEDNKAYDYSSVNNAGFLYRDTFNGESSLSFNKQGLKAQAATVAILQATEDEPTSLFIPGFLSPTLPGGSHINAGSFVSMVLINPGIEMEPCTKVYEADGPTQARPFFFLITDAATSSIVQMGRVNSLDGEFAGKQVCQSEKNCTLRFNTGAVDNGHVISNDYAAIDTEVDVSKADWTTTLLNTLSIEAFTRTDADAPNILSSPLNSAIVNLMSNTAATEETINNWLSDWGAEYSREQLLENLQIPDSLNMNTENRLWIESDYQVKPEYLHAITNQIGAELKHSDFLENSYEARTEISDWFSQLSDKYFDFGKLIGNRTRLFYASAENTFIPLNGELTTGTFADDTRLQLGVPLIKLNGEHKYYEDDTLRAIDLGDTNNQLLVLMPKAWSFNTVQTQLKSFIEHVSNNLTEQSVNFSLPLFSLSNTEFITENESDHFYNNASEVRPLLPLSQYSANSFSLNETGFHYEAHSLSALVAPADDGTVGRFSGTLLVDRININLVTPFCTYTDATLPTIDSRPFIFVLRDRESGVIKQLGGVTDVVGNSSICFDFEI